MTLGAVGVAGLVWLALLAPLAPLLGHLSGQWVTLLAAPGALTPLFTSLAASTCALLAAIALGTPLAYLLARGRLPAPRIWQAGLIIPLLMPPLVVGLLLVFLVGPLSAPGQTLATLHLSASNTFLALVIAEIYESLPYYILAAQASFSDLNVQIEHDAALLGHSPVTVFRRVTLPLAAPGLANALSVAWARAMGAFGAVVIIAYHPYGLPMQIWVTLQETGVASALPFALLLLVVALPLPLLAYLWSARAQGRS